MDWREHAALSVTGRYPKFAVMRIQHFQLSSVPRLAAVVNFCFQGSCVHHTAKRDHAGIIAPRRHVNGSTQTGAGLTEPLWKSKTGH